LIGNSTIAIDNDSFAPTNHVVVSQLTAMTVKNGICFQRDGVFISFGINELNQITGYKWSPGTSAHTHRGT
jgi:hypothetical protein